MMNRVKGQSMSKGAKYLLGLTTLLHCMGSTVLSAFRSVSGGVASSIRGEVVAPVPWECDF